MDDITKLDPSTKRCIAGQQRLNQLRMAVRFGRSKGAEGRPELVIRTSGGECTLNVDGISFHDLVGACEAFNTWIATGAPVDAEDPTTARLRRNEKATAIGNHVRDLLLANAL